MSMDTLVFGAIRPAPASCDEREKRPKQEPELVSKPESESESDSESDSESGPNWDWTLKREKDLNISDFSSFDNYPKPFSYVCPRFSYVNEAMRREEQERKKALAEYRELSRDLTPFDAIPVPPKIKIMASNFPTPIDITKDKDRNILTELSHIALAHYNAGNQVEKHEFNELVKATSQHIPRGTYYITFNAKRQDAPSNSPATTFQAHVWDRRRSLLKESPVVESCSVKI